MQCLTQRCLAKNTAITEEVCGGVGKEFCNDALIGKKEYTGAASCSSKASIKYSVDTPCPAPVKPKVNFFCSQTGIFPDLTDCQK